MTTADQRECREAAWKEFQRGRLNGSSYAIFSAGFDAAWNARRSTGPDGLSAETADLVDRFAVALKHKLAAAEAKYGYRIAWMNGDWRAELIEKMAHHVQKGDPRDVAAYCAFAWHHGWSITPPRAGPDEGLADDACLPEIDEEAERDLFEGWGDYLDGMEGEGFDEEDWRKMFIAWKERARIALRHQPSAWRPISEAPKDGSEFIGLTSHGDQVVIFYDDPPSDAPNHYWHRDDGMAYHRDLFVMWHPLLPVPALPQPPR